MNPAGQSTAQNPQANNAQLLQELEQSGRTFFMKIVLATAQEVNRMLDAKTGSSYGDRWQSNLRPDTATKIGWVETDLSQELADNHYMNKYASLFSSMIVDHSNERLRTVQGSHLRAPSRIVWPTGPNRLTRMINDPSTADRQWRYRNSVPGRKGYYDVVYNLRDGIMILLRQLHPAEAIREESPLVRPPFNPAPQHVAGTLGQNLVLPQIQLVATTQPALFDASSLWLYAWNRQRGAPNSDLAKKQASLPPKLMPSDLHRGDVALKELSFIIVPEIGLRYENTETQQMQLEIINMCLKLSGKHDLKNLSKYRAYGSYFPAGTWCVNALLATPPNSDITMLLARHKTWLQRGASLGHKTIVGVSIVELDAQPGRPHSPTLVWEIGDLKEEDNGCAESWGAFKFGEQLPLLPGGPHPSQYGEGSAHGKGKGRAKDLPNVPEKCYPEIMRKWQTEAAQGQSAGGGTADDPTMVDDDDDDESNVVRTGDPMEGVVSTGQASGQSGSRPFQPGQSADDPLRRIDLFNEHSDEDPREPTRPSGNQ